jgi:predicted ATPase
MACAAMIEKVTLQNYKCLRDVTLELSPFTVLIGPNDSGKSSLLDAIGVVGRPSRKYRIDPAALRSTSAPSVNPTLTTTGDNLAAVLDALITGPDRDAIHNLEEDLRRAVPTLRGVALRTVAMEAGGYGKALEFVLAGSGPRVTIPASQASEGALLLTAFLTLAHGDTPDVLLIEEPENGLHPSRLEMVIDLLRKISTGEVGNRPRQVIVTTHNPLLLNYVRPEEVRVVRRDPETGTEVRPMTEATDLPKLLEEFALGELWYMLREDGLFARKAS